MGFDEKLTSRETRVRIIAKSGWAKAYAGQECDAIFYQHPEQEVHPQINTEQLRPPLPKWQSILPSELEVIA